MSLRERLGSADATRALALLAVAGLLGASLQVLYHFIDVTGVPSTFLLLVAVTLVVATVVSRVIRPWLAVLVGALLLVGGLAWYLNQLVGQPPWASLIADTISLFFGRSLLHITGIRAWVLGVSPAPVFLTWYFAMRRNYTGAVLVAGGTLGFFVLTTDADAITTLSGVVAGTAALALGDMERRGEPVVRAETVVTIVAVMIVVPAVISVVPAGAGASGSFAEDLLGEEATLETSLMTDERVGIQGSISLSPEVRFSVTSERGNYWRVASYDRYTGEGWIRTGGLEDSDGFLSDPDGPAQPVRQTVRAEARIQRMPAAWKPVRVSGFDGQLREAPDGSIQPARPLEPGEAYSVRSQTPAATPRQLQNASTDYPDRIEDAYTQLPASTPERFTERTSILTANAETPYETARTIERWLENNREYSLDVRRPRGDIADAFLFEMERGYCTYYATTMVAMLRSQDIPARFVTGYTSGERVDEDEWVVRGLDSHAWVEVYFPEYGWQRFDPTPGGPREAAEDGDLTRARQQNETGVDTDETRERINESEWTPEPTATPPPLTTAPPDGGNGTGPNGTTPTPGAPEGIVLTERQGNFTFTGATTEPAEAPSRPGPRLPTRQQFTLAVVAVAGVAAGLRRTSAVQRTYRAVWLRYQPRTDDPAADVERAFQRMLYDLQQGTARKRLEGETVREYLDAVNADQSARRVAKIRERARYAGRVTEAEADEAVRLVNERVR